MLMDKGYYDYDFEAPKEKAKKHENTEERTKDMAKRFGFGNIRVAGQNKPMSAEQLQLEVMEEEKKKQSARHGKSV